MTVAEKDVKRNIHDMQEKEYERLRRARVAAGFKTSRSACKFFGWNENTYRSHETRRGISKRAAIRYAKAFNVDVGWLLFNDRVALEAAKGRDISGILVKSGVPHD